ncbi:MAG: SGNH/GDSL hydrolase family protein [bacterium]|nr:SGNH/GDSL hydrolase family protein [bacterium]
MTEVTELERYVAIGDSQTEGLHDYHRDGQPRGWADRFAEHLSASHPELLYANLAVRGKRTGEVRHEQLGVALSLSPDLATVVSGVNDVVRPSADVDGVASDIEAMYAELAGSGCLVMGCTFPLPRTGLTRKVAPRLQALNSAIRAAARRQDVLLVELEEVEQASDLRLWSADRIHLNPDGHERLAAAFDATFRGNADEKWMEPLPPAPAATSARQAASEAMWIARFLVPKMIRMLCGRSSGDGQTAKRPRLRRLDET